MVKRIASVVTLIALAALLLSMFGCTMAKISGRGALPLLLNNPTQKVDVIEHFKVSKMRAFDYTASYDVSEIIADKLSTSGADAAINLVVTVKGDFGTFMINLITLGLASARTIQIEGDLVKTPQGLSQWLEGREILAEASNAAELAKAIDELGVEGKLVSGTAVRDGKLILF